MESAAAGIPQQPTPPEQAAPASPKQERERSTIEFPYLSLDVAMEIAKGVHWTGGSQAGTDLLAAHMNEAANGGSFRNKIVTARIFGLATYSNGVVTLTPLGQRLADPDQEKAAKAEAFLHVPLYKRLYEDYKGTVLPPTNSGLEAVLVNLGVATKQKDKARQAFIRSASLAGFFAYGNSKLVYPILTGGSEHKPHVTPPPPPPVVHGEKPPRTGGGGGGGDDLNPFVRGLLTTLPEPKSQWSIEGRKKWLQSALSIFDLIYEGADESQTLVIKIEKTSAM